MHHNPIGHPYTAAGKLYHPPIHKTKFQLLTCRMDFQYASVIIAIGIVFNMVAYLVVFPGGLATIGKIDGDWVFIFAELIAICISMAIFVVGMSVGPILIAVEIILLIFITMLQPYVVKDCSSMNFNWGLLVDHLELYIILNGFHFIVGRFIFNIFFLVEISPNVDEKPFGIDLWKLASRCYHFLEKKYQPNL
ncbi:unnamed protein product [Lactuca virosa]|uniref:Uncharacterized protein n=1 Tax=Lactuca virosa TaxID=75947 RepID=A0AAU9N9J1_9ASTR|nr:unnamed protein product [Lactuca virosa]